jgi:hypothetical protein
MIKLILTTTALLSLATPAFAAIQRDIAKWEQLHETCVYGLPAKHPDQDKICAQAAVLEKRLKVHGYCTYGHGVVGRSGSDGKICHRVNHQ